MITAMLDSLTLHETSAGAEPDAHNREGEKEG